MEGNQRSEPKDRKLIGVTPKPEPRRLRLSENTWAIPTKFTSLVFPAKRYT